MKQRKQLIRKTRISKREANKIFDDFVKRHGYLEKKSLRLEPIYQGRKESSLERIRKDGMKINRAVGETAHGIFFGTPPETIYYTHISEQRPFTVFHKIPKGYITEKMRKGLGKLDQIAGPVDRCFVDIPPSRIKTFIRNVAIDPSKPPLERLLERNDPLLFAIEKRMNKDGKTILFRGEYPQYKTNLLMIADEANCYSLMLADDAYEKHKTVLQKAAEENLRKKGAVDFGEMRKKTTQLGILPELQDYVIGSILLDLKLRKTRHGYAEARRR